MVKSDGLNPETICPACGLWMPDNPRESYDGYFNCSAACWSLFTEVAGYEFGNAPQVWRVHQLTVDSYAAACRRSSSRQVDRDPSFGTSFGVGQERTSSRGGSATEAPGRREFGLAAFPSPGRDRAADYLRYRDGGVRHRSLSNRTGMGRVDMEGVEGCPPCDRGSHLGQPLTAV